MASRTEGLQELLAGNPDWTAVLDRVLAAFACVTGTIHRTDPATGLLPRYLNLRLSMTNNVDVSPALSPSLRSMGVIYRVGTN